MGIFDKFFNGKKSNSSYSGINEEKIYRDLIEKRRAELAEKNQTENVNPTQQTQKQSPKEKSSLTPSPKTHNNPVEQKEVEQKSTQIQQIPVNEEPKERIIHPTEYFLYTSWDDGYQLYTEQIDRHDIMMAIWHAFENNHDNQHFFYCDINDDNNSVVYIYCFTDGGVDTSSRKVQSMLGMLIDKQNAKKYSFKDFKKDIMLKISKIDVETPSALDLAKQFPMKETRFHRLEERKIKYSTYWNSFVKETRRRVREGKSINVEKSEKKTYSENNSATETYYDGLKFSKTEE